MEEMITCPGVSINPFGQAKRIVATDPADWKPIPVIWHLIWPVIGPQFGEMESME